MLFNSPEFLLGFLPVVLVGFFLIGALGRPSLAAGWLILASLFFYGWWRIDFMPLLLASILFNFSVGRTLARWPTHWLLAFGIAGNLAALGWFKYAGFLAQAVNDLAGAGLPVPQVVLPLAISFYTFQQIAYLVDAQAGETRETSLARYALFVVFFPQLIAGPIVHHKEMLSQFEKPETYRPRLDNLVLGLTAFSIGLFKKVFIADPLGSQTPLAFGPALDGVAPGFADAWFGSIAFALQLYFDFSGYSDMAIGLGLMFGIRLPVNFASPYKSASIIEFWTRWHMTLTRFLTAYLYTPLVMAAMRRRQRLGLPMLKRSMPAVAPFFWLLAVPTLITMGLAGIWHGAGWQFLVFGLLHGVLLVANHAWRYAGRRIGLDWDLGWAGHAAGVVVTFLAVTVTFVFFKAVSLEQAMSVVQGMVGLGEAGPATPRLGGVDPATLGPIEQLLSRLASLPGVLVLTGLAIVWLLPNTPYYISTLAEPVQSRIETTATGIRGWVTALRRSSLLRAQPSVLQGAAVGILLSLALLRALSVAPSEFLYFTF